MKFPELDDLYREVVLDHYKKPRGICPVDRCDVKNDGFNPTCGDEVELGLRIDDGKITGVHVKSRGCSISVSSGSMLAESLRGRTLGDAKRFAEQFRKMMHGEISSEDVDMGDLEALEGVQRFPVRIKCALLPWTTLVDAIAAWEKGHPAAPTTTQEPEKSARPSILEEDEQRRFG